MSYEIVSTLPPGGSSRTRLAMRDGRRKVVLRVVREGVEPFLPERTPEAVLPLIEVSEQQGVRYAVYDYLPGATFRELVEVLREHDEPVPLGVAARVVIEAARAVGELHAGYPGLPAHGGLSDSALFVGFDGAVRVLDYGVPRASRFQPSVSGGVHGDVFALGAVLHSALTDFAGAYADAVDEGVPLPPPTAMHEEATPALDDVLARATSRAFAKRQVDATALAEELDAVLRDVVCTRAQLADLVARHFGDRQASGAGAGQAVQLEADADALGYDNDAPTGAHVAPWLKPDQTSPALEPVPDVRPKVPAVPWVTGMTLDNLPRASDGTDPGRPGPVAPIPSGTEPGRPGPAVFGGIPQGTEPGRAGPFAGTADAPDDAESTGPRDAPGPAELGSDEGAVEGTLPRAPMPEPPADDAPRVAGPRPGPTPELRAAASGDARPAAPRVTGNHRVSPAGPGAATAEGDAPRAAAPRVTGSHRVSPPGPAAATADGDGLRAAAPRVTGSHRVSPPGPAAATAEGDAPRAAAPRVTGSHRASPSNAAAESELPPDETAPRVTGQRRALAPRAAAGETAENEVPAGEASAGDVPPALVENESTRPRALPPAAVRRAVEPAPELGDGEPEPTRPRAKVPIESVDTNPRAAAPIADVDTNPRASAPRGRNTTVHEKLQARGQERISTPPLGVPMAGPDEAHEAHEDEEAPEPDAAPPSEDDLDHGLVNEPTNVRPKPKAAAPAESQGELPATGEAGQAKQRQARTLIAGLLLLLAVGFGAVALFAPQKLAALKVRLGLAPPPGEAVEDEPTDVLALDAGADEAASPDGGALAVAALGEADGGEGDEDADGGEGEDDEEDDADGGEDDDALDVGPLAAASGADGGPAGAPTVQAGDAGPTPEKSPPKKKKKKRRRRR